MTALKRVGSASSIYRKARKTVAGGRLVTDLHFETAKIHSSLVPPIFTGATRTAVYLRPEDTSSPDLGTIRSFGDGVPRRGADRDSLPVLHAIWAKVAASSWEIARGPLELTIVLRTNSGSRAGQDGLMGCVQVDAAESRTGRRHLREQPQRAQAHPRSDAGPRAAQRKGSHAPLS